MEIYRTPSLSVHGFGSRTTDTLDAYRARAAAIAAQDATRRASVGAAPEPMSVTSTEYGTVTITPDSVRVAANGSELRAWANRPGAHWPCSELAEASEIVATFDTNGLVELEGDDAIDLSSDELSAWTSDAIGAVLSAEHPCHFVVVGQFA